MIERCEISGITIPECSCWRCLRRLIAAHASSTEAQNSDAVEPLDQPLRHLDEAMDLSEVDSPAL